MKGNDHRTAYWATQQDTIMARNCHFLHNFISNFHITSSPKKRGELSCIRHEASFFSHDNHPFNCSFIHIYPFTHSFTIWFIFLSYFILHLTYSTFSYLNSSLILFPSSCLYIHSFIHSFIHFFINIHSFIHSF